MPTELKDGEYRSSLILIRYTVDELRKKGYSIQQLIRTLLEQVLRGEIFPNQKQVIPAGTSRDNDEFKLLEQRIEYANTQNRQQVDIIARLTKEKNTYKELLQGLYALMDSKTFEQYIDADWDFIDKIKEVLNIG